MSKIKYTNIPVIEVLDNKLVLSPKAVEILNITPGERIVINYVQVNNEITYPIIAKSIVFGDPENGNKCSKSNTVLYKGAQREILTKYGNLFRLESNEKINGTFSLISIKENELNDPE